VKSSLPTYIFLVIVGIVVFVADVATSQEFGVTSSPNVVGSGARALGVGGAFIAIADDGTAASWNPAALIILEEPEAAIMFSYEDRERFGTASFFDFNYIAASYPFTLLDRNMIVSFNYQRLFDFNSKFETAFSRDIPTLTWDLPGLVGPNLLPVVTKSNSFIRTNTELSNDVTGDIGAIAPAFAIQITPDISIGATLNFWVDGLVNSGYDSRYVEQQDGFHRIDVTFYEWVDVNGDTNYENQYSELAQFQFSAGLPDSEFRSKTSIEREFDFFGINANIGGLWSINKKFTVGAVYKLPFTATANISEKYISTQKNWDSGPGVWIVSRDSGEIERRFKISFPAVYGLGTAYKFNDKFTMAFDAYYTPWQDFTIQEYVKIDDKAASLLGKRPNLYEAGNRTSAVNGIATKYADIDGVITARLGAEYRFIQPKTVIPVRAGLVYDPEPAQGQPDEFYAATVGTGIVLFKKLLFDVAYQYRWSQSATLATVTDGNGKPVDEVRGEVTQHMVVMSSIYYF